MVISQGNIIIFIVIAIMAAISLVLKARDIKLKRDESLLRMELNKQSLEHNSQTQKDRHSKSVNELEYLNRTLEDRILSESLKNEKLELEIEKLKASLSKSNKEED